MPALSALQLFFKANSECNVYPKEPIKALSVQIPDTHVRQEELDVQPEKSSIQYYN